MTTGRPPLVAGVLCCVLILVSCAGPAPPRWREITPLGMTPTSLFVGPSGVLVGGAAWPPDVGPVLVGRHGDAWRGIPAVPVSGYARVATLVHLSAAPDGRVVAIGTATGGAHLNPRWTTWIGDATGIVEEPQTAETFGGWNAGGLTGVVAADDPAIVGAWSVDAGSLGVAAWRHEGTTWVRQPSPRALTGSPPAVTESATAAAAFHGEVVIVGLETDLVGAGVHQRAVLWRSDRDGWRRIDLDTSTTDSAATDVTCTGGSCLVAGRLGGALAAWRVGDDRVVPIDLPPRAIDHYAGEPRIASEGRLTAIAVGDGSGLLTSRDAGPWTNSTTPTGQVRRLGVRDGMIVLLLRDPTGAQRVYQR